jgi:hypothetical protein
MTRALVVTLVAVGVLPLASMAAVGFPGDFLLLPCPTLALAALMCVASFRRKERCS